MSINLLQSSTAAGTIVNFGYDADDWRIKKSVQNGATSYFMRGPNGQLLTEWLNTNPNAEVRDYIYAGSRLIAVVKSTTLSPR